MQIHVVQNGDTLFSIANMYDTTVSAVYEANELSTEQLVIGQALVIPINGQYYFVQAGDSLFSIATRFLVSVDVLARVNQININDTLPINLRLYIPPLPKQSITSFGYIEPYGDSVSTTLENAAIANAPLLTFLAPFSYRLNRDGTLSAPPLNQFLDIASENKANSSMVITNLEGPSFSSELVKIILNVQAVQRKLIDEIINIATKNGFQDIHFDFEFILPEDR
ncbi:MAG TPA: LysM peptidoglycan-binding domain-containing protein, partial [Pseudogracilibacillus sp.]|nr:LysM peptidoglycan-binding domain-containing protein [Pseudogracilibacillus sp.]